MIDKLKRVVEKTQVARAAVVSPPPASTSPQHVSMERGHDESDSRLARCIAGGE